MTNDTKTQSLVTLPKEVAEALEDVLNFYNNSQIIATIVNDRGCTAYGTKYPVLIRYAKQAGNIDILMSALVNGYQVEKTQEELEAERLEKVGQYFSKVATAMCETSSTNYYEYCRGKRTGVVDTLNVLGLSIPGVNE